MKATDGNLVKLFLEYTVLIPDEDEDRNMYAYINFAV